MHDFKHQGVEINNVKNTLSTYVDYYPIRLGVKRTHTPTHTKSKEILDFHQTLLWGRGGGDKAGDYQARM